MTEIFKFRILESERINMAEKAKLAAKVYYNKIINKAIITAALIIAWLTALHLTLINLDGAHRPWLHQLCWIAAGITVYIAYSTITDALAKKRCLKISLTQIALYGHIERLRETEYEFESAFLEVYKINDKKYRTDRPYTDAYMRLLVLYSPEDVTVTTSGSFTTVSYATETGRHMCFCTERDDFYRFFETSKSNAEPDGTNILTTNSRI